MADQPSTNTAQYEAKLRAFNADARWRSAECRIYLMKLKNFLFLRIEGKAQQRDFQDFVKEVRPILASRKVEALVIDLSLCEVLASSAIGLIAFIMMEMKRMGTRIHLVRANDQVMKSLSVMGLSRMYTLNASVEEIVVE